MNIFIYDTEDRLLAYRDKVYKKINIRVLKNRTVLDVGCGLGVVSLYLSQIAKKVVAFDIQKAREWKKYKKKNLSFHVANAEKMPFRDNIFDGVYLQDVLHHVKHPEKVLKEIDRVTSEKSIIILLEGNRYNPIMYLHMTKLRGHEHLSGSRFKKIVKQRFKNVEFRKFESHYLPFLNDTSYEFVEGFIEFVFEKLPVLNNFPSYNLAIIKK